MSEFDSAFAEATYNNAAINWRYWVHQMPTLTTAQAACLMSGLDPDIFSNLDNRPNQNAPYHVLEKARNMQRLAEITGMQPATPNEWMEWAEEHKFTVHDLFCIEVKKLARERKKQDSALGTEADQQSTPAGEDIDAGASAKQGETPQQRRARISSRLVELKSTGVRRFLAQVAEEEGVSVSAIKKLRRVPVKEVLAPSWFGTTKRK